MNKSSISLLAKAISSKRGLKQAEAERFVTKMFEVANQALDDDKQLKVRWLGSFKVAPVKDRESVDVNTGERIVIEGRDRISFTPDNILKEIINKPFAQFETVVVNDGVDFSDIDEKFAQMKDEEEKDLTETKTSDVIVAEEAADDIEAAIVENEVEPENKTEEELQPEMDCEETSPSQTESETVCEEISQSQPQPETVNEESSQFSSSAEVKNEVNPLPEITLKDLQPETPVSSEPVDSPTVVTSSETVTSPSETVTSSDPADSPKFEDEEVHSRRHHFVIPKYMVAVVCVLFVALLGGMGWFAFNYGKMQAQRDQLAAELAQSQLKQQKTTAKRAVVPTAQEDSTQAALKAKAKEDSARLAASNEAVKLAEKTEREQQQQQKLAKEKEGQVNASKYDSDPRVRTGAYRIVGVAQIVTVSSGQTITGLSKRYLGAGMECYIEAINGTTVIKEGQKVKIPKLELKRRKAK